MSDKHHTPLPAEVYTTEASQSAERAKQEKSVIDNPEEFKKLVGKAASATKGNNIESSK